jgi:hypothetical protein
MEGRIEWKCTRMTRPTFPSSGALYLTRSTQRSLRNDGAFPWWPAVRRHPGFVQKRRWRKNMERRGPACCSAGDFAEAGDGSAKERYDLPLDYGRLV